MQKLGRLLPAVVRRWRSPRRVTVELMPNQPDSWLSLVAEEVKATPGVAEVALDMHRVNDFDLEELDALSRILENTRAEGLGLVLKRLQPGPLGLLVRLGLTRFLGVRTRGRGRSGPTIRLEL